MFQFSSVAQSCPTLCNPMNRSTPCLPVHHQLPGFTQIHVHWISDAIQPSHPLSSPSPPAPNPSQHQGLFQWANSWHEVVKKYWSFSFNISPSNEHSGLISLRMDWLDLLAFQQILKSLLQHHCSKALILRCSAFFIVQLSHLYMTTGKTIALTRQTFIGKVMSLLLNMLSRRSLVGCSPWGPEELDTTEQLRFHFSLSCIGGGGGSPLQCSCLESPRDGGAWWAAVSAVAESDTTEAT